MCKSGYIAVVVVCLWYVSATPISGKGSADNSIMDEG